MVAQHRDHLRVERESSRALQDARARVLRLCNQVAVASQEATTHAQKECNAMKRLEEERARAEAEAQLRRDEGIQERVQRRKKERATEQLFTRCPGRRRSLALILRIGSP